MKAIFILLLTCLLLPALAMDEPKADEWPEYVNIESDVFLGIQGESISRAERQRLRDLLPPDTGLCATYVVEGSPAAQAGICSGDILISIDRYPMQSPIDLLLCMRDLRPGDVVQVEFLRRDQIHRVAVTIAARACPVVVAVARRLPSPPLQEYLEEIQAHQIDLARLLVAPCPSQERIRARLELLEQLTHCRRPQEKLCLFYTVERRSIMLTQRNQGIVILWGTQADAKTETLNEDGGSLSPPLRELLKTVIVRHRRIKGVSDELKWQLTPDRPR